MKICSDCKWCDSCIMSAPDGRWSACERFEGKEMDLISREQALNLLNLNKPNVDEKTKYAMWQFDKDLQTIKTMPSAEKTGKWIEQDDEYNDAIYQCSVCGEEFVTIEGTPADNLWNYCPNCGAKMEAEND